MVRKTGPNNHNNAGESGRWQTGQGVSSAMLDGGGVVTVPLAVPERTEAGRGNAVRGTVSGVGDSVERPLDASLHCPPPSKLRLIPSPHSIRGNWPT